MRPATRLFLVFAILFAASTTVTFATVLCVKPTPSGSGCWATAYTDLQPALAAAGSGDEIWVAAGTYKPTATTDRTISFAMKNGVGIYGGFNGTETSRTQRNPAVNVTVLSGDIGATGNALDNSYHVLNADAAVSNTGKLDGFTVFGGQADGTPASNQDRGGGLWVNGGSPMLTGVLFTTNYASFRGGAVRVESGAPRFISCLFTGNTVAFGAGGAGLSTGGGSVSIESCIFRSNSISGSSTGGGGIQSAGNTTLLNCVVAQNSPNGLQVQGDNNLIQDSTFTANNGYGAAFIASNNNTISNSVFWGDLVPELFFDFASTAAITYSDVQGGAGGAGNINADPLFLAAPADLRPGPGSPAVDSGNNTLVPGGTTLDVAGLPRFFDDPDVADTGVGNVPPGVVDMGAYERIPITVTDPASQAICAGGPAVFNVTATGQPTLTYQWRKDSVNLADGGAISGATTDTLTINPTVPGDSANYDIVVTDGFGQTITSAAAALTVNTAPALPVISAPLSVPVGASGASASVVSHAGSTWAWTLTGGTITAGQTTRQIVFDAGPPGTTMLCTVVESNAGCSSPMASKAIQVDFLDVPPSNLFHDYVDTVARNRVTAGCGGGNYCPTAAITRAQMAVFLLKAEHGSTFVPPSCTGVFADVPCPGGFAVDWIEQLALEGVTGGCGGGNYCPNNAVRRDQMAVFLLKAHLGSSYVPPPATGTVFADVLANAFAAAWIEDLYARGITGGCLTNPLRYCPTNPNNRQQMAVFITKTFNLQ